MSATFPRATFRLFLLLWVLVLSTFCNKTYSPILDPIQNNIVLLTGNSRAIADWKLTNLYIDQVRQPLTAGMNTYSITYNLNGKFQDSDGMEGVWTLETADSLRHKIINNPGVMNPVQGFRILNLTSTDLALRYYVNGKTVQANYTIVK
jgi:hypothetical protein